MAREINKRSSFRYHLLKTWCLPQAPARLEFHKLSLEIPGGQSDHLGALLDIICNKMMISNWDRTEAQKEYWIRILLQGGDLLKVDRQISNHSSSSKKDSTKNMTPNVHISEWLVQLVFCKKTTCCLHQSRWILPKHNKVLQAFWRACRHLWRTPI